MNKNKNSKSGTKKEVFTEPTCELVEFSFEDVLVNCKSNNETALHWFNESGS